MTNGEMVAVGLELQFVIAAPVPAGGDSDGGGGGGDTAGSEPVAIGAARMDRTITKTPLVRIEKKLDAPTIDANAVFIVEIAAAAAAALGIAMETLRRRGEPPMVIVTADG